MSTLTEALAPKSDQLNADDLIPGPRTIKITGARIIKDGRQLRITLNFEGDNGKPFKPCKTMGRAMVMVWAITDDNYEQQFIGKSLRVYRDPSVKFGDQGEVGGIRISHMSHIDKPARVKLTVSQGQKREFVFQPLPKIANEGGNQRGRQTPQEWVADHKDAIDDAATIEDLDLIEKSGERAMGKLKAEHPDLHTEVMHAYQLRREALSVEKRPDEDYGEDVTEDDLPEGF
jgi:hypothetical protein